MADNLSDNEFDDEVQDPLPNANQKYVLMSFVSPDGQYVGNRGDFIGFKVRGVFSSYDKAQRFIKTIQETDKSFDIFCTRVGKWIPFPSKDLADKVPTTYMEEEMNKLVNKEVDSTKKRALEFEEDTKKRIEEVKRHGSKEGQAELNSIEYKQNILNEIETLRERLINEIREMSQPPTIEEVS